MYRYTVVLRLIDLGLFPLLYDSLNKTSRLESTSNLIPNTGENKKLVHLTSRQVPTQHQITLLKILDSKFFSSLKIDETSISLCIICIVRAFNSICPQV